MTMHTTFSPQDATSQAAFLTITILDSATIFEGPETVYRYDLPGSGVLGGWALEGIIEQARTLCAPDWPDATVAVVADPESTTIARTAVVMVSEELTNQGVSLAPASVEDADDLAPASSRDSGGDVLPPEAVDSEGPHDDVGTPPRNTVNAAAHYAGRRTSPRRWLDPFHLGLAATVLAVGAVSWWAISAQTNSGAGTVAEAASEDSSALRNQEANAHEAAVPEDAGNAGPAETSAAVVLEEGDVRVKLPLGFTAEQDKGVITATGDDPHLRILLAADPAYSVPQEALFAEIKDQIKEDPQLKKDEENARRLVYTEDPGDGSAVTWTTWVEGDHQMSVGCHTKSTPTTVQKAACRMAVDSLQHF
ncbi:type VII secretion-associated protein [Corynebacterium incognita]|uniref:Type VII secretion-associated protein n=1 Tax=Corynebacterium incognita TaxID=2754725 RepID=A0A7G7CMY8_9CORY|nr:type VII secretion-associated protein [Corynebacterium incognita]QNE88954.1 type VII secretion-associated protein [Corynebacterium incognita]